MPTRPATGDDARTSMTIRSASSADAAALAVLSGQLGYPGSAEEIGRRLTALCARPDHEILVGEVSGAVIAWVHVFGTRSLVAEPFAEVGGLVVDADHRGRGLGAALLAAAETWAAGRGYEVLRVRSNIVRVDAHRFYERQGYQRVKQSAVFVKRLE
jgi:GNAT superfamily N-acetyltransferase